MSFRRYVLKLLAVGERSIAVTVVCSFYAVIEVGNRKLCCVQGIKMYGRPQNVLYIGTW